MSFVQEKLSLVALQSSGIFNLYVYEPDNGDAIADVLATGYFSQSRFIGTNGWVDAFVFCSLDDGAFTIQIQASGITAAQVGAGGGEIPAIEADIELLDDNVRGVAIIDMENDDRTMTDAEAASAVKFILNAGDGTKTLTYPTTSDALIAKSQSIVGIAMTAKISLVCETGGTAATIYAGSTTDVVVIPGTAVISTAAVYAAFSNSITNGVSLSDTINNVVTASLMGAVLIANSTAGAQAWTIDTVANEAYPDNATFKIHVPLGCDGMTVTGDVGVTLTPASAVIAAGETLQFVKENSSDNWYAI